MAVILNGTTQGIQSLGSPANPVTLVQVWGPGPGVGPPPGVNGVGVTTLPITANAAQNAFSTNVFGISVSIGGDISGTPTDTAGNTYVLQSSQTNGLYNLYIYACVGIVAAAAGNVFTVNFTAPVTASIQGVEYGVPGGLDGNIVTATGATANSTATLASQYPNAVVVCFAIGDAAAPPTAGAGFTIQSAGNTTALSYGMETQATNSIQNVTCGMTGVGATAWTTIAIALYQTRTPASIDGTYTGFFKYVTGANASIFLMAGVQGDEYVELTIGSAVANQLTINTLPVSFSSTVALTPAVWYHYGVTIRTNGTSQLITLFYKKVGDPVSTRVTNAAFTVAPSLPIIFCYGIDNNDSITNVLPTYDRWFPGTLSVQKFWWNAQLTQADIERESEQLEAVYANPWSVLNLSLVTDLTDQSGGSTEQFGWIGSVGTNTSDPPIPRTKPRRFIRKAVAASGVTLTLAGISSDQAVSPPAGSTSSTPAGIGPTERVSPQQTTATSTLAGIPGESTLSAPSGSSTATPAGIPSTEALSAPTGSTTGTPAGIPSAEALSALSTSTSLALAGITGNEQLSAPAGTTTGTPAGIGSAEALSATGTTTSGTVAGIPPSEALNAAAVSSVLSPAGIGPEEQLSAPVGTVTMQIVGIPPTETLSAPAMSALIVFSGFGPDEALSPETLTLGLAMAGIDGTEILSALALTTTGTVAGIPAADAFTPAETLVTITLAGFGIPSEEALSALVATVRATLPGFGPDEVFGVPKAPTPPPPPPPPKPKKKLTYAASVAGGGGGGGGGRIVCFLIPIKDEPATKPVESDLHPITPEELTVECAPEGSPEAAALEERSVPPIEVFETAPDPTPEVPPVPPPTEPAKGLGSVAGVAIAVATIAGAWAFLASATTQIPTPKPVRRPKASTEPDEEPEKPRKARRSKEPVQENPLPAFHIEYDDAKLVKGASRRFTVGDDVYLVRWITGHAYLYKRTYEGVRPATKTRPLAPIFRDEYRGRIDDDLALGDLGELVRALFRDGLVDAPVKK